MAGRPRSASARPPLRDRRRGRLHPHRRGPDPLIISGRKRRRTRSQWYDEFARARAARGSDVDYDVDEKKRTISVLETPASPGRGPPRDRQPLRLGQHPLIRSWSTTSIKAKELFHRDKDYVVMNGEVLIVDEHTGRIWPAAAGRGRRPAPGDRGEGGRGSARVPDPRHHHAPELLPHGDKLAGMTGTAMTEAPSSTRSTTSAWSIPTNKPMVRVDQPDLIYRTETGAKYDAVVGHRRAAREGPAGAGRHRVGRGPSTSPASSRAASPHRCSTPRARRRRRDRRALAGRKGAVTVATNMATRHRHHARRLGRSSWPTSRAARRASTPARPPSSTSRLAGALERLKAQGRNEHDGSEARRPLRRRHRAPRVAAHRQPAARPLRRQGDPGESGSTCPCRTS